MKKIKKKHLYLLMICTACVGLLISKHIKEEPPIRIAFIGDFGGRGDDLARSGRDGAMLAVEQWNAKGGVKRRQIELMILSEQMQSPQGLMEHLEEKKTLGVIGPMSSATLTPLIAWNNEAQRVMISPSVDSVQFSNQDDWFFQILSNGNISSKRTAQYHVAKGVKQYCVIWDKGNESYAFYWLNDFEEQLQRLGAFIEIKIPYVYSGGQDLVDSVKVIQKSSCAAVVMIASAKDVSRLILEFRKNKTQKTLIVSEWAATDQLLHLGGNTVEGVYMEQFMNRSSQKSSYQMFVSDFSKRFGRTPGFGELASYDATQVLLMSLDKAKKLNNRNIKEQLLSPEGFDGVQEHIVFSKTGDAQRSLWTTQIRNGHFHVINDEK